MSKQKSKPTYESIRYDIRPSSGLTDVESDYLNTVAVLTSWKIIQTVQRWKIN